MNRRQFLRNGCLAAAAGSSGPLAALRASGTAETEIWLSAPPGRARDWLQEVAAGRGWTVRIAAGRESVPPGALLVFGEVTSGSGPDREAFRLSAGRTRTGVA
jgi:hypothetical protein